MPKKKLIHFISLCMILQAVKRDPTNAAYRNNLAAALTKIGDFNAAKAACEKVRFCLTVKYSHILISAC